MLQETRQVSAEMEIQTTNNAPLSTAGASSAPAARCDRRLSRAAREIVRLHLELAWKAAHKKFPSLALKYDVDVSEWNVWQLLHAMIGEEAAEASEHCPLRPSLDVWRHHEENSVETDGRIPRQFRNAAIPGMLHAAGIKTKQLNPAFHQCGLCRKNFTSQYYLDRHFDYRHNHDTVDAIVSFKDSICPATDWCAFLSDRVCHDMALELEPYYGPGSAGFGPDKHTVHRNLQRLASQRPCTEERIIAVSRACSKVITDCFLASGEPAAAEAHDEGEDDTVFIREHLNQTLCAVHSCHGRIYKILSGTSPFVAHQQQMWREEMWTQTERHHIGFWGFIVVCAVVAFYVTQLLDSRSESASRSRMKILRLNKKRGTAVIHGYAPDAPTTYIGDSKSKQH
jgi:hypothetical protein